MPIRVLLVDDVVEVRRLVRTALRFRGGFEVVGEASSGAEAVQCAADLVPDVIVLDLGLPDFAGHEVLSRLRAAAPRTKVVVFSGNDVSQHEGIEEQVEGYVLKDTQLDHLIDLLESVSRRDAEEAHLDLPRELTSVRLARRFVAGLLAEWGLDALRDDALLVTSELAANAITHADSTCRLRVSLTPTTLRIDVVDTGAGTPEPQPPSATEEHGRGLHLVAAVTTAWGLELIPDDGKVVWAELLRPA
jgi:CheY-like chemotaxis protein/anti-sigma regulatory factor (Ser/Thr protein kinase)